LKGFCQLGQDASLCFACAFVDNVCTAVYTVFEAIAMMTAKNTREFEYVKGLLVENWA